MISKARIKQIHSLRQKKHRDESGLFVGEGPKVVGELLKAFPCTYLAATPQWLEANHHLLDNINLIDEVNQTELNRASLLDSPQQVVAVFGKLNKNHIINTETKTPPTDDIKDNTPAIYNTANRAPSTNDIDPLLLPETELVLALDCIQDPGNMGTIIRLANWFGIRLIVCSPDTVDAFAPKVVQATMGALTKVDVVYTALPAYFQKLHKNIRIYGTFLDGDNIYSSDLENHGIIVMGNEGNGISNPVSACVSNKLFIPPYPANANVIESLNVGVATAIVCAEFRRRAPG